MKEQMFWKRFEILNESNFDLDYWGIEKMAIKEERRFYELVKKVNYTNEEIEKIIDLFSFYLNIINTDHKYNQTYLNNYVPSFCRCISYIREKQGVFEKIVLFIYGQYNEQLFDSKRVELDIDNLWWCAIEKERLDQKQQSQIKIEKVCSRNSYIRCTYFGQGGKKYMKEIVEETIKAEQINAESIDKINRILQSFLEKYLSEDEQ